MNLLRINMAAIGSVDDIVELNSAASLFGGGSWYGTAVGLFFFVSSSTPIVGAGSRRRREKWVRATHPGRLFAYPWAPSWRRDRGQIGGDRASEELGVAGRGAEDASWLSKTQASVGRNLGLRSALVLIRTGGAPPN